MKRMIVLSFGLVFMGGCYFDAVSTVNYPNYRGPRTSQLFPGPGVTDQWQKVGESPLAAVYLDKELYSVPNAEPVYARVMVVNQTNAEIGVLVDKDRVTLAPGTYLPPPAGAKLAVPQGTLPATTSKPTTMPKSKTPVSLGQPLEPLLPTGEKIRGPQPGDIPEYTDIDVETDARMQEKIEHGVLVTVPPHSSLQYFRVLEDMTRSKVHPQDKVTVSMAPGIVVSNGRWVNRIAEKQSRTLVAPAQDQWGEIPLGSLILSTHGPVRLVPSTQPVTNSGIQPAVLPGGGTIYVPGSGPATAPETPGM